MEKRKKFTAEFKRQVVRIPKSLQPRAPVFDLHG
jgi:hypothetical protein